jgi:hypothetical protein
VQKEAKLRTTTLELAPDSAKKSDFPFDHFWRTRLRLKEEMEGKSSVGSPADLGRGEQQQEQSTRRRTPW